MHADSDGQCDRHLVADIDRFHILKKGEAVLPKNLGVALLDHEEIFILLQLPHDAVHRADALHDLPVNQRLQERAPDGLDTLQRLIVIIQIDQAGNHLLVVDLLLVDQRLRLIDQEDRRQTLIRGAVLRPDAVRRILIHADRPEVNLVKPILILRMDPRIRLDPVEEIRGQLRKISGERISGPVCADDPGEFPVHPEDPSVRIDNPVGDSHTIQQLHLRGGIPRRKVHEPVHQVLPLSEPEPDRDHNLRQGKSAHRGARRMVDQGHGDIGGHHKESQDKWPVQVFRDLPTDSDMIFHE